MVRTPSAEEMYLRIPGLRPVFQGDIFRDVPFAKVWQGNSPDTDPAFSSRRSHVATILYPCDMVTGDNVTLIKAQPIVRVYDAANAGLHVSDILDDVPVAVCPLPDLNGDGRMWVADFRTISVVDRSFLTPGRRVRCLSEQGWAIFRQRLGTSTSRAEVPLKAMLEIGAAAWSESQMGPDGSSRSVTGRTSTFGSTSPATISASIRRSVTRCRTAASIWSATVSRTS